jgi:hypothetical protein
MRNEPDGADDRVVMFFILSSLSCFFLPWRAGDSGEGGKRRIKGKE